MSNKRYHKVKTGNARFSYFSLFSSSVHIYSKSNQLLSWNKFNSTLKSPFWKMLLYTGKLLNPLPVPVFLLKQSVTSISKLLLPWSTSSDTYCEPLLSNKRFQNNQIISGKKSNPSSNLYFGNMLLHTGQLFSPHPVQPLGAKQQFYLLLMLFNVGMLYRLGTWFSSSCNAALFNRCSSTGLSW